MRISIGIFAHNSARSLDSTLESLFQQELLAHPPEDLRSIEVHCLANGCTDATLRVAEEAFIRHAGRQPRAPVSWHVRDIPRAGKSNAWNEFVHRLSDPEADVLFCMDADVTFVDRDALGALVRALRTEPHLRATVGRPVKHLTFKASRSWADRISLGVSEMVQKSSRGAISGWLYAIRGGFARTCWMPQDLQVEDGFLAAMVGTDQFRSKEDPSRVRMLGEARVCSEAYTSIRSILRHEIRLLEGSVVNSFLFADLWANSGTGGAGVLIDRRNAQDPRWLARRVNERVKSRGSWVIPREFMVGRLVSVFRLRPLASLLYLPLAILRTLVDWYVAVIVNGRLRRGRWGAW